jgi:tripartite-type tricarboxylate transporter receptor subunit TctC
MIMRHFSLALAFLIAVYGMSMGASILNAQPYPNRPVQLVIPGSPGLMLDMPGRLISEEVGKLVKQQIVIVNKPGASMTLGTDAVAKSKKDGYTLLFTGTAPLVYPRIMDPQSIRYDSEKDLEPLGGRTVISFTVAVQESSPWKRFAELIEYAKKNPGNLRAATPGIETTANFDLQIIQSLTGAQFNHVPMVKGPAVALLGGHIEVVVIPITETVAYAQSGKFRILLTSEKIPQLPETPTLRELGYKADLISAWFGFYGPSGLPDEVKKVLVPAIEKAVRNSELKARLEKANFSVDYKDPSEMRKLIAEEYDTASAIAKKLGLSK